MSTFINITPLYNLVNLKKNVNAFELQKSADAFYRGIKSVGIRSLNVFRIDENGNKIIMKALDLSERVRGTADWIVRLIYRFDDYSSGRLERHFGITTPLELLFHDVPIFTSISYSLSLSTITIQDIINELKK